MLTEELKKEIDEMPFEQMLRVWRFSKPGFYLFAGNVGDYFRKVMKEKQSKISGEEYTKISKEIGW